MAARIVRIQDKGGFFFLGRLFFVKVAKYQRWGVTMHSVVAMDIVVIAAAGTLCMSCTTLFLAKFALLFIPSTSTLLLRIQKRLG